ncbi:CST complex subunit CTC1-like [Macrobrachium rosenbergii]|uniref:CST complex subunit CTC1-like n=1 Tax=Macrobrachium rosenbergii TaxID=79674 RepID=UPI0034D544AE
MEKQETISELEGTLTALSYTFLVGEYIFWLMELHSKGSVYHVMVRHPFQLPRRNSLQLHHRYRLTDLKPQNICKERLLTYVARSTSQLQELSKDLEQNDLQGASMINGLISYRGVVTKAIDEDLGIWELDGSISLVLSFLCHLTGEIWSEDLIENVKEVDPESAAVSTSISKKFYKNEYLKVGDHIAVHHVHHSVIKSRIHLTCCGRSSLENNRIPKVKKTVSRCENSIVDILHLYGLSLSGLHWLLSVKNHLVEALCPKFADEEEVVRSKVGEKPSILLRLIEDSWERGLQKVGSRSLVREFLRHDRCAVTEEFTPPFSLMKIKEVLAMEPSESAGSEEAAVPQIWNYHISQQKEPSYVVGTLSFGDNGILQLYDVNGSIDILILGAQNQLLEGSLVALYNFSVVVETFIIRDLHEKYTKLQKKYIIVDRPHVVVLKEQPKSEAYPLHETTNVTIISKSNVMCIQPQTDLQHTYVDKFFIAKAVVNQTFPCGRQEKWDTFVRFSGKNALAHSCFEDGYSYTLHTGLKEPGVYLKKTCANIWLRSMQCHYGTSECVYIPEETKIVDMTPGRTCVSPVDIERLLDGNTCESSELITVIGVVQDRQLMTSKFESEISHFPLAFTNNFHIGVPGSKILRILMCDSRENSNSTIWIYFMGSQNYYIPQYPLGILPGMKIEASCVIRKISKNTNRAYLRCSNFSVLTPLSLPPPSSVSPKLPHRYLREISEQEEPFQVIAHIECIQKVILKSICIACKSEMIEGNCSYVGCSSPEGGMLSVYVEMIIDDGSETAQVFMDSPNNLQLLLQLKDEDYSQLHSKVTESGRKLSFNRAQYLKGASGHVISDEAFGFLCSHDSHCRPMRLECRKFRNSNPEEGVLLYCFGAFELDPENDVKIWESKHSSS